MGNKSVVFPATVNTNLAIRIPTTARAILGIAKGDKVIVTVRKETKTVYEDRIRKQFEDMYNE